MPASMQFGRFQLSLERPLIMGIVNVTPDSFSDGNSYFEPQRAIDHAHALIAEGADILDIGGESTRPGAKAVTPQEEIDRIAPVLTALADCGVPISVDTCRSETMAAAIAIGVDMINDVTGFRNPTAISAVLDANCALCLMHMLGEPRTMQDKPEYADVVQEVHDYLLAGAHKLEQAGIESKRIVLDPGFGFGKTVAHNYAMLRQLSDVLPQGYVNLLGMSRKSMLGAITGRPANQRLGGSIAAALAGAARGANILRVHDVADTVAAVKVWQAVEQGV